MSPTFTPDTLPTPRSLGLDQDDWWPHQVDALLQLVQFLQAQEPYAFFLIAPPGSGKTLMKLAAALLSKPETDPEVTAVVHLVYSLTNTKQLQDQEKRTLPTIHPVKGRSNYDCMVENGLVTVDEGPCQAGWKCPSRSSCSYYKAKAQVSSSPVTSMNYAIFLADRLYVGDFPAPDVFIGDEAHNLERILTDTITIEVREQSCIRHGIPFPPPSVSGAMTWAYKQEPLIRAQIQPYLARQADGEQLDKEEYKHLRRLRALAKTLHDLLSLRVPGNWVVEQAYPTLVLKPIWVRDYSKVLWGGAGRLLLTSATIPDPEYYADTLSLGSWEALHLPSTFAPERRPVVLDYIKSPLTYKTEHEPNSPALAQLVAKVDSLISRHSTEKGVIHCGSYRRGEVIREESIHQGRLVFLTADTKDYWLTPGPSGQTRWETDPRPLVMVSPSVWEGVDMPDKQLSFQVLCKVPYPSLGSPWVEARSKVDPKFYPVQTCLATEQTVGRAMRNHGDYGISYLVDPGFDRILDDWSHYFSGHFLASVVRPPRPGRPTVRRLG